MWHVFDVCSPPGRFLVFHSLSEGNFPITYKWSKKECVICWKREFKNSRMLLTDNKEIRERIRSRRRKWEGRNTDSREIWRWTYSSDVSTHLGSGACCIWAYLTLWPPDYISGALSSCYVDTLWSRQVRFWGRNHRNVLDGPGSCLSLKEDELGQDLCPWRDTENVGDSSLASYCMIQGYCTLSAKQESSLETWVVQHRHWLGCCWRRSAYSPGCVGWMLFWSIRAASSGEHSDTLKVHGLLGHGFC